MAVWHSDESRDERGAGKALKRRGILAAAGAVMAGIVAKQAAQPVAASASMLFANTAVLVTNTASGQTELVATLTGNNVALNVDASPSASSFNAVGVLGKGSNAGPGLMGLMDGVAYPGAAENAAVYGQADGTGFSGIFGVATNGTGVKGSSGTITPPGTPHAGVYGYATAGSRGVSGVSANGNGIGVAGECYGAAGLVGSTGVSGATDVGIGVRGEATGSGIGVYGASSEGGNGVYGIAAAGTTQVVAGVFGDSTATYGVIGRTTAAGYSGLTAITGTAGVAALAATSTNPNAFAAFFTGTTVVQGNFVATGGTKSAAVKDASGQHRLVYCVESPESWFEDFGTGQLVSGKASVMLDKTFTEIVHTDAYHIFLTPRGDFHAHVAQQTATGFVVQQTTGTGSGSASGSFSYRVVAKRADITGERLARFEMPKIHIPDESKLIKPEPRKAPLSPPPRTNP